MPDGYNSTQVKPNNLRPPTGTPISLTDDVFRSVRFFDGLGGRGLDHCFDRFGKRRFLNS
jgi:hypothetical protein